MERGTRSRKRNVSGSRFQALGRASAGNGESFSGARHTPVLLHEVITLLEPRPGCTIVDGTVDGGGHADAIRKKIAPGGVLFALDLDEEMAARYRAHVGAGKDVIVVCGNYADLPNLFKQHHLGSVDGVLLDLGFSSEHLENAGRGFSFLRDEPLVMTYAKDAKPLRELLREMQEKELARIIRTYGGERYAGRIARVLYARARRNAVSTSGELADAIRSAVPRDYERGRIHPATRTFQALRMYANDELGNLERFLSSLPVILKPGGRVAIVSFHSLEDGLVKRRFREMADSGVLTIITKKPVAAKREEQAANPRSRSAKLRAAVMR